MNVVFFRPIKEYCSNDDKELYILFWYRVSAQARLISLVKTSTSSLCVEVMITKLNALIILNPFQIERIGKNDMLNQSCVVITDLRIIVVSVVLTFETGDETTSEDTSQGDTLLRVGLNGVVGFSLADFSEMSPF